MGAGFAGSRAGQRLTKPKHILPERRGLHPPLLLDAIVSGWACFACLVWGSGSRETRQAFSLSRDFASVLVPGRRSRKVQRRILYRSRSPAKAGHKHLLWQSNRNIASAFSVWAWLGGRNSEFSLGGLQTALCGKRANTPNESVHLQFLQCCFISPRTLHIRLLTCDLGRRNMSAPTKNVVPMFMLSPP